MPVRRRALRGSQPIVSNLPLALFSERKKGVVTHEKGDENGSIHQDQREKGRPSVAQPVGDGTGEEDSHKGTALSGLEEGGLPFGGNGILHDSGIVDSELDSVLFFKVW